MFQPDLNDQFLKLDKLNQEINVIAFLDLSNMFGWQSKLKWSFDIRSVINQLQQLKSVSEIRIYYGTNTKTDLDMQKSEGFVRKMRKTGAIVITKPVKWIKKNISTEFLIRKNTLSLFDDQDLIPKIEEVVKMMKSTNQAIVEEPKCNFDVEMSLDIVEKMDKVSGIILFSGDSDFAEVIKRVKVKNKKTYLFGVRNSVAQELWPLIDEYFDFGRWYIGEKQRQAKTPRLGGAA